MAAGLATGTGLILLAADRRRRHVEVRSDLDRRRDRGEPPGAMSD